MLTAEALAARWRCSPRTVNRMAQTHVLPALKRGRHWRFSIEAVEAYERRNTTATTAETVQTVRAATSPVALRPAVEIGGEYAPVVKGPVPWRSTVIDAASPAARRGGSARTKKAASVRS